MLYIKIDTDISVFLHLFLLFVAGMCYLIAVLTKYSFYKYLDYIKPKTLSKFVFILHWIVAIICALFLPNNLKEYNFYNTIISQGQVWEYVITLLLLFTSLIIVGFCLNSIFRDKTVYWEKANKSGSR